MKKLLSLLIALVSLSALQAQTTYSVSLNAAQENVSTNTSTATGSGTLTLNLDNTLSYNISYSGLQGNWTASHIHGPAGPGTNASVVFPLVNIPSGTTAGTLSGTTAALSPAQISDLNAGWWYANIHSSIYGSGEIRGQIVPEPSAIALMGLGAAALIWRLRRKS